MGQFTKEQFGEAHYEHFGNDKRKLYYKDNAPANPNVSTPGNGNTVVVGDENQVGDGNVKGKDNQGGIGNVNVKDTGDVNNHNEVDNSQEQANVIENSGNNDSK